ncbi:hypothetical protein GCM10011328_28630 [Hafnia psychrotolerans]|uniref:Cytosine deaminase n=1 Tax=Hafnia psychrotolerans TaxID=1477018 RepID=A0ABQ1GWK9_9GAMM|nr:hypothetical protein GCM10011328_28630 [Hafnia psychrotolerans]
MCNLSIYKQFQAIVLLLLSSYRLVETMRSRVTKPLLRTIKNVRMPDRDGLWQIDIEDGVVSQILSQPHNDEQGEHILDGEGGLAIAPFIEPHIHLDTTQTAGQPSWNQSGTLFEGIERWAERKALLCPTRR